MTHEELVRAIRLDLAAEEEAIFIYMAHAEATDHPLARKVLIDVANEEREHVGEFQRLLQILTGDEDGFLDHGREEVDEMAAELGSSEAAAQTAGAESEVTGGPEAGGEEATIGSLKE
jgi:rubrerythrin